jgi:hypothetical protein
MRLQTIIDLGAEENSAQQPRYTLWVTAIALLLAAGGIVSLVLLWR